MKPSWHTRFAAVAALLGWVGAAQGQDSAASQALFNVGLAEMEAHRWERACPALFESYQMEARAGTLFTLAECEVAWGRIASACTHYDDYLQQVARMPASQRASHAEREVIAARQKAAIAPEVPTLTLTLAAPAPRGLVVLRDGVALGAASFGLPIPTDPGQHVIVVQLPGTPTRETRLIVARGEHKRHELAWQMPVEVPVERPEGRSVQSGPRSPWIYVAAGVGAGGIAAGTITGLMSASRKRTVDDNCMAGACNAQGMQAADSGRALATASTVTFSIGFAGLATAAVLLFVPPARQDRPVSRRVMPIVAGDGRSDVVLGVGGAF